MGFAQRTITKMVAKMAIHFCPKFKLIQVFMVVLVFCKSKGDPCKTKALDLSQHFSHYKSTRIFPHAQGQLIPGQILPNFEPIQALIAVLLTCKNEEDTIKYEGARVVTTLYMDISGAQGQLTLELVM